MKFVLDLPVPINQTYKTNRRGSFYKSTKAKDWSTLAGWQIKKQAVGQTIQTDFNEVILELYLKWDRDIDSSLKSVLDLLQAQGIYKDDKQIESLHAFKFKDKKNPRLEVTIV